MEKFLRLFSEGEELEDACGLHGRFLFFVFTFFWSQGSLKSPPNGFTSLSSSSSLSLDEEPDPSDDLSASSLELSTAESLFSGEPEESSLLESLGVSVSHCLTRLPGVRTRLFLRQLRGRVGSLSMRLQSMLRLPGSGDGVGKCRRIRVSRTPRWRWWGGGRENKGEDNFFSTKVSLNSLCG